MGVLVDIVPNHMGVATPARERLVVGPARPGRASAHADAFDVDWDVGKGRVLIPVLGDDDLLDDGRIAHLSVVGEELRYHDHRFPLAPGRRRPATARHVHDRQHYELVAWRRADSELNYRRFFAVNTLAGVRVEDRGFRRVARGDPALVRRGSRRRAARRPPRRPARPGGRTSTTWPGSPAAPTCWSRRSSSPARPCRPRGRPRARPGTTSWVSSTGCSPTRPGRDPSTRSRRGCAAARSTGTS